MAIMLAGLRGVDEEIWKAARSRRPAEMAGLCLDRHSDDGRKLCDRRGAAATGVVRLYDLSVAMTNGGPGIASEVPAKFVMDHLFERANIGLAHGGGHHRC